jgi:hypothetical protein
MPILVPPCSRAHAACRLATDPKISVWSWGDGAPGYLVITSGPISVVGNQVDTIGT